MNCLDNDDYVNDDDGDDMLYSFHYVHIVQGVVYQPREK